MFKLTAAFYEVFAATYTLDYVLKHPNPKWPDTMELPELWREAVLEYLRRIGISKPEKLNKSKSLEQILEDFLGAKEAKKLQLMLWPEIKRLFNRMVGHRKNRPRNTESMQRKEAMKSLKGKIKESGHKLAAEVNMKQVTATGEMSEKDINKGGEYYDIRLAMEAICKRANVECKVRPFDTYQGPVCWISKVGKMWMGQKENHYVLNYFEGGISKELDATSMVNEIKSCKKKATASMKKLNWKPSRADVMFSKRGSLKADYKTLEKFLGKPQIWYIDPNDTDEVKSTMEWKLMSNDGKAVVTIYDFDEHKTAEQIIKENKKLTWSVGARNSEIAEQFVKDFEDFLGISVTASVTKTDLSKMKLGDKVIVSN